MTPPLTPIPGLRGLLAYAVPKHPAPIDLPLHGNEGPAPSPALFSALGANPELLRRYPSTASLEALLARRMGLDPARVLVTAGADEALDRAFRAFLAEGDAVVLPSPTFVMLPHYARLIGARVIAPPWPAEDFPTAAVLDTIDPATRAIALVSPNNPTGAVIPKDTISAIAEAAPHAAIFVDFAYIETAESDPTRELLRHPNVLIFRTLSKVWGLAGARVGYILGSPEAVTWLRAAGPPYPCSALSLAVAEHQLTSGEATMRAYVDAVRRERGALYDLFVELGTAPVRSQGNFVFVRCGSKSRALWLRDGLAGLGIGVRAFPGEPDIADGVRITCPGDEASFARLVRAVRAVLRPAAKLDRTEALFGLAGPAWFFGRTLDDLKHARVVGAVPIGLGDPSTPAAHAMLAAGAARVVPSPEALEEELR